MSVLAKAAKIQRDHGSLQTSALTVGTMIRQPSSVIVAGPSGSGKSELVEQWLRYLNVFQVTPKKGRLCVRPMATPVRPYAKRGWHSVSSRVTGPQ